MINKKIIYTSLVILLILIPFVYGDELRDGNFKNGEQINGVYISGDVVEHSEILINGKSVLSIELYDGTIKLPNNNQLVIIKSQNITFLNISDNSIEISDSEENSIDVSFLDGGWKIYFNPNLNLIWSENSEVLSIQGAKGQMNIGLNNAKVQWFFWYNSFNETYVGKIYMADNKSGTDYFAIGKMVDPLTQVEPPNVFLEEMKRKSPSNLFEIEPVNESFQIIMYNNTVVILGGVYFKYNTANTFILMKQEKPVTFHLFKEVDNLGGIIETKFSNAELDDFIVNGDVGMTTEFTGMSGAWGMDMKLKKGSVKLKDGSIEVSGENIYFMNDFNRVEGFDAGKVPYNIGGMKYLPDQQRTSNLVEVDLRATNGVKNSAVCMEDIEDGFLSVSKEFTGKVSLIGANGKKTILDFNDGVPVIGVSQINSDFKPTIFKQGDGTFRVLLDGELVKFEKAYGATPNFLKLDWDFTIIDLRGDTNNFKVPESSDFIKRW